MKIRYDAEMDCYWVPLPSGKLLWCNCPITLEEIVVKVELAESKREETRALCVAIGLAAILLSLSAVVAALLG